MSDVVPAPDRDEVSGRFLPGNKRGGRKPGARDRHSRNLLNAFADDFEQHGIDVIRRVREEQPAQYLKIATDLLPKEATIDVDVSVFHDVRDVVEAYRLASELLGSDPGRGLRRLREIEHEGER